MGITQVSVRIPPVQRQVKSHAVALEGSMFRPETVLGRSGPYGAVDSGDMSVPLPAGLNCLIPLAAGLKCLKLRYAVFFLTDSPL
jgi:hypothetical protein